MATHRVMLQPACTRQDLVPTVIDTTFHSFTKCKTSTFFLCLVQFFEVDEQSLEGTPGYPSTLVTVPAVKTVQRLAYYQNGKKQDKGACKTTGSVAVKIGWRLFKCLSIWKFCYRYHKL